METFSTAEPMSFFTNSSLAAHNHFPTSAFDGGATTSPRLVVSSSKDTNTIQYSVFDPQDWTDSVGIGPATMRPVDPLVPRGDGAASELSRLAPEDWSTFNLMGFMQPKNGTLGNLAYSGFSTSTPLAFAHALTTHSACPLTPNPQLDSRTGSVNPSSFFLTNPTPGHPGFASQEFVSRHVVSSPMAPIPNIQQMPPTAYSIGPTEATSHAITSVSQVSIVPSSSFISNPRIKPMTSGHTLSPLLPFAVTHPPQASQQANNVQPFLPFDHFSTSSEDRHRIVASNGSVLQSRSSMPIPVLYPPNRDIGSQHSITTHNASQMRFMDPPPGANFRHKASSPIFHIQSYEGGINGITNNPTSLSENRVTPYRHGAITKQTRTALIRSVGTSAGSNMSNQDCETTSSSLTFGGQRRRFNISRALIGMVCEGLKSQEWVASGKQEPPIMETEGILYHLWMQKLISSRFDILYESSYSHRCLWDDDGNQCSHETSRKDHAQDHARKHLNYAPFKCGGGCGKRGCASRFRCNSRLKEHKTRKHSKRCEQCEKYITATNFARHQRKCVLPPIL